MIRRIPPALAAGLVLADSSIVTLALPEILRELDLTVAEVAWVLVSFNVALALAAVPGAMLARRAPRAALGLGLAAFAAACLACALADGLGLLVGGRVLQGVAGAVVVAAALELLLRIERARAVPTWATAGVLGAAVGPAAGGILTDVLSWQAMFALQAPVALAALAGLARVPEPAAPAVAAPGPWRPQVAALAALALASAALAAALFLLVTMVIEGWRHGPAAAAGIVTVLPVSALLAPLVAGALRVDAVVPRAAAGALLLAGGLAALGLLPDARATWTIAPQVLIGLGLGLLVTGLTRIAVPVGAGPAEVARDASLTILARHAGVVAGLLLLTPVFSADLDAQQRPTERAAIAQLLDAPLPLTVKVRLARALGDVVEASDGRLPDLGPAFAKARPAPDQVAAVRELRARMDDELDRAGTEAFSRSFLVAAGFALLALAPIGLLARRRAAP